MKNEKRQINQNEALDSSGLFYDPAYLKMKLFTDESGNTGPRHTDEIPGVQVQEDSTVAFCFYAPQAKKVEVSGFGTGRMGNEKHTMEKDEQGYWHVLCQNIPVGFHYHEYFVDNVCSINSQAPIAYAGHRFLNYFEKAEQDFYLLKQVPHGTLRMEHYFSNVTGKTRNCWVYTPPGYDAELEKTYPVLYLQHGGGENETAWIWQGKINYIMDNLLAEGACQEMLVVMNSLYCVDKRKEQAFLSGDFDSMLMQDCIPFIEKSFRVSPGNKNRAMAGLSMGSYQTIMTTLGHLGEFPYIGIFSGTPAHRWYCRHPYQQVFEDAAYFNEKVKVLFFGYGDQEENIIKGLQPYFSRFQKNGLNYTQYCCYGYHEWSVWRNCLRAFLPLCFEKEKIWE